MGILVLFALAVLGCAIPDFAPSWLGIARHAPDLFTAVAAYLGLRGRGTGALIGAVMLGLLQDCASLDPLGTHAFVLGVVALVFLRPGRDEVVNGPSRAILVALACVLARFILVVRTLAVTPDGPRFDSIVSAFPVAFWTALATWPLLSLLERTHALEDFTGGARGVSA